VFKLSVTDSGDVKQAAATTTSAAVDFEKRVRGVHIKTDANVYVAFDRAATTGDFLLASTDLVVFFEVPCTEVHLKAATTANVYLVGVR